MANPFPNEVGGRVLPDLLTVTDDPTLSRYQSQPLLGAASVDDDGVRTRRTVLVENGVLKALLATRNPVPGVAQSTGSRRGAAAAPSHLLVTAGRARMAHAMKPRLL